jgi:starch synthase
VATGIVFQPVDAVAFGLALRGLLTLYANKTQWAQVQKNAMKQAVGWEASAAAYAALYEEMLA